MLHHDGLVYALAFGPEGTRLATASYDGSARLWDTATGQELAILRHDGYVNAVAFSPDGARLATASNDTTARLWRIRLEDLLAMACERVTRNLSQAEWQQYLGEREYRATCPGLPVPEETPAP